MSDGGQSTPATERPGHPGWICTKCAKLVSSRPFGRCHDCGGIFREATREDALCDRCGDSEGNRLLDRSGDYDRLCESCTQCLDLRTRRSWDTETDRAEGGDGR